VASRFWAIARRPRWIAALLLCLGIAAGFAGLGQWQLSRSVENGAPADAPDTEVAVPLSSIAEPQTEVTQPQLGRRVTVEGELVPSDFVVLTGRNNGDAGDGAWLVGHLVTTEDVLVVPPVRLATVPGFETGVFSFTTDIPWLDRWGQPLLLGPGSVTLAHTKDEYCEIVELTRSADLYARLASTLIG